MGKACAVLNCDSGSYADRKQRKERGVRQLSLFKSPKSPRKRLQWSHILDCHLRGPEFICELHFLDRDIRKVDRVVLSNGMEHIMPRAHWSLNLNALPFPIEITMLNGNDKHSPNDGASLSADCGDMIPSDLCAKCETSSPVDDRKRFGINNDCEQPMGHNSEISLTVQGSSQMIDGNSIHKVPTIVDYENTKLAAKPQILSTLTLDSMKKQFKDLGLPEAWSWLQRPSSLMFTCHDRATFEARIHLQIGDDLSATICTSTGHRIRMDSVKSMSDVQLSFREIEKLQVCNGTGIESERRAPNCIGVLNANEEYKRARPILRCHRCRDLRQKLQKCVNHSNLMTEHENSGSRRKLTFLRKRSMRLKSKARKLIVLIEGLKQQCSTNKQEKLEAEISTPLNIRLEAV